MVRSIRRTQEATGRNRRLARATKIAIWLDHPLMAHYRPADPRGCGSGCLCGMSHATLCSSRADHWGSFSSSSEWPLLGWQLHCSLLLLLSSQYTMRTPNQQRATRRSMVVRMGTRHCSTQHPANGPSRSWVPKQACLSGKPTICGCI